MKQFRNFPSKKKSDISKKVNPEARKQLEWFCINSASFSRQQGEGCCPLSDQGYRAVVKQVGALRYFRGNSFNFRKAQGEKAEKCRLGKPGGPKGVDGIPSHITISSKLSAESEKSGRGNNPISSTMSNWQMTASSRNLKAQSQKSR